jgi:hypothetical protein
VIDAEGKAILRALKLLLEEDREQRRARQREHADRVRHFGIELRARRTMISDLADLAAAVVAKHDRQVAERGAVVGDEGRAIEARARAASLRALAAPNDETRAADVAHGFDPYARSIDDPRRARR